MSEDKDFKNVHIYIYFYFALTFLDGRDFCPTVIKLKFFSLLNISCVQERHTVQLKNTGILSALVYNGTWYSVIAFSSL